MNKLSHKKIFLALTWAFLSQCSPENTTTGNPATVDLNIQGTRPVGVASSSRAKVELSSLATPTQIPIKDTNGTSVGTLTITSARIALKKIELKQSNESSTEDSGEIDFEGPYVVDLLANTSNPDFSLIRIPAGTYREIQLNLDKIEGDEVDGNGNQLVAPTDPLYGNSIYLEGTYTGPTANSGNVTDIVFKLTFDFNEEFTLSGAGDSPVGMTLTGGTTNWVIVAFRMLKWFKFDDTETNSSAIEPSALVTTSGEIILDATSTGDNQSIREIIKENIKESADYGKDSDGDGQLSSEEDDDPDTEDTEDD